MRTVSQPITLIESPVLRGMALIALGHRKGTEVSAEAPTIKGSLSKRQQSIPG